MSSSSEQAQVNINDVLKRASALSKDNNWTLVQGLLCILGISLVVYWAFFSFYEIDLSSIESLQINLSGTQQVIMDMTLIIILAPLWTGVTMLAILYARNEKPSTSVMFAYINLLPLLAVASGIVSVLVTVGFVLFVFPSFYFFTASTFALPLIADKKCGPLQAIILSIQTTNKNLWPMLGLYTIFALSMLLIPITFGLAYLWIGPLYFNAKAILYQDLFCDGQAVNYDNNTDKDKGIFNA